ncbi:PMEI domain-containing protein [Heracleum sosnowskyi]|uniref:PMEI domain-containing protein n=1 Tax=Heracleum sosnowskyi TaxID=360622 RepID=A0AAD8JIJ3_9APIA|nr:PMEI domain-containing protein [Heracleum sosnowskyi]
MIIVLALFANCGKSQAPSSSHGPHSFPGPVNEFCRTADHKELCTRMVRGATNLHDATKNAVESALNIALKLQQMYTMLEPALKNVPPKTKKSVLETCRQNFDNIVDDLKTGLDYIDKNDLPSLNVHLSAVTSSDCSDAFDGALMPRPVADRITMMTDAADNCLAVSEQS